MIDLRRIADGKQFERLCADILEAEGFQIRSEPYVDTKGFDISATYEYRAHSHSVPSITINWLVQCKHYAASNSNIGRKMIEEVLFSYDAIRGPQDGLLIITSTDFSERSEDVANEFMSKKPHSRVMLWNQRRLIDQLDRHPHLAQRYGLGVADDIGPTLALPPDLSGLDDRPILFLSDQSSLAHDLYNFLRLAGLHVVFLPVWNYQNKYRFDLFLDTYVHVDFSLAICFLGDTFDMQLPNLLEAFLAKLCERGTSLLLFPFVAWSIAQGGLGRLANLVPARLSNNPAYQSSSARNRLLRTQIVGDIRSLLAESCFEEDEYREYDPASFHDLAKLPGAHRFGLSHTFEHLEPIEGANVIATDTLGNPMVVKATIREARVCYLNTCCHSCMNMGRSAAVLSPFANSGEFREITISLLKWLLERRDIQQA